MKASFLRASLCMAIISAGMVATASESVVTLESGGQELLGTLTLPEGDPAPVAVLLHGFTGTRDELSTDHVKPGVFAYAATALAEQGIASLRIDFRGSGESLADLTFADTTFEGQIADANAAVKFLKNLNSVDGDDIHVVGWSQGGLVAASMAGRGAEIDTLSLWNAVGEPMATYGGLLGDETLAAGIAASPDEVIDVKLPWGAEIELKGAFFDGVESHDPIVEIQSYTGPLFVAVGTQDTAVDPVNATRYIDAHDGPEKIWQAEMDHVFNIFGTVETLDSMLIETISFIKSN